MENEGTVIWGVSNQCREAVWCSRIIFSISTNFLIAISISLYFKYTLFTLFPSWFRDARLGRLIFLRKPFRYRTLTAKLKQSSEDRSRVTAKSSHRLGRRIFKVEAGEERAKLILEEKLEHNFANCVAEKLCDLHTEFKRDHKHKWSLSTAICFGNVSCTLHQRYNITNCYSMCYIIANGIYPWPVYWIYTQHAWGFLCGTNFSSIRLVGASPFSIIYFAFCFPFSVNDNQPISFRLIEQPNDFHSSLILVKAWRRSRSGRI